MADSTTDKKPGVMQRLIKAAQYLINGADQAWFGPGQPIRPMAPAEQAGRQLDYPISVNTRIQPRPEDGEGITFADLRALADNHDVTRLLIETRKDQLEALEWTIKADLDRDDKSAKATPDQENRIDACMSFFKKPDGVTPFSTWLRMLVEDLLVIDQPVVYVNTENPIETKFEPIDGATIKRFLDGFGSTPTPPNPAYQQIIHGMPSWDYTTDEIVYMPRNPRTHRMYGLSPVQQIVMIVNIAMRRQLSQLQYFTDGNIPDALIGTPKEWTPQQVAEFQRAWDALHEGNTAQRRHAKFVPGDAGKIMQTREVQLKDEFDEWLARIACYAFSMPPTAFVAQNNRATAQTAKQASEEEGLAPLMRWVKQFMNELLQKHMGQDDLVFDFVMSEEQDLATQVELIDTQVKNGTMTINEAREILGRDPVDGGDTAMIFMGTQPIPVEMAAEGPPPPAPPMIGGPGGGKPPFGGGKPANGQKALPAPKGGPKGKLGQQAKKPNGAIPAKKPNKPNGPAKGVGKSANAPFVPGSIEKYSDDEQRDERGRWTSGGTDFVPAERQTFAGHIVGADKLDMEEARSQAKDLEDFAKTALSSENATERNQGSASRIIAKVIDKAYEEQFADFEHPNRVGNGPHFSFAVDHDGEVVGAIHTSMIHNGETVEVHWLGSLVPGGGSQLLRTEMEYAKSQGATRVQLTSLASATGFYEKLGFHEGGDAGEYEANIDHVLKLHKIMDGAGFVAITPSSGIAWDVVTPKRKLTKRDVSDEERDDHGRWTDGGGEGISLKATSGRAWAGDSVKLKTKLSKLETGALGERIAIAYLQANGLKDAKSLNVRGNNFPVDLVGDHELIEVKAGLASNSGTAQQWRATIGGPGKEEKAWLKVAAPEERRAWNLRKQAQILDRKNKVVRDFSKKLGRDVKPRTLTAILNPDKRLADLYMFKGFHSRISWNSDEAKKAFVGTYRYGG